MDLAGLKFVPAKTMPNNPHEYVVRNAANQEAYEALYHAVRDKGVWEKFGRGRYYLYLYMGGYKYWVMNEDLEKSCVINRCRVD
jgi:hypothetical protein